MFGAKAERLEGRKGEVSPWERDRSSERLRSPVVLLHSSKRTGDFTFRDSLFKSKFLPSFFTL